MTRCDIARMYGYNSVEEYDEAEKRKHELYTESLKRQKPYVEKEPVKIQPVKRGKWVNGKCTICGKSLEDLFTGEFYYDDNEINFCPNCGSDMRDAENG